VKVLRIGLAVLLAGCCGHGDVGCLGSLQVLFDRPLALPFQYETPTPGQILQDLRECNQDACARMLILPPTDTVVLRISRGGQALFEMTLTPEYRTFSRQNSWCGPFCRAATVNVTVPSAVAATMN
jgi:hypothetical protein